MSEKVIGGYNPTSTKLMLYVERCATTLVLMLVLDLVLVSVSGITLLAGWLADLSLDGHFTESNFQDDLLRNIPLWNLLKAIECPFGALIMLVAGLIAVVAAAMRAYKTAVRMLAVAAGALILRYLFSYVLHRALSTLCWG
jgi:hypothetical protein